MPRTNSRKRNNHRNDITSRVPVASNLSPTAPEFVPINGLMEVCNGSSNASNSRGNNSNSSTSEIANISTPASSTLENQGQRDLLINLLNNSKVDCVICYEQAKNVEPIWNCRHCFQIMHLKCVMVWFIKSHTNSSWRCPACQSNIVGKPHYVCFCGSLPNPFSNHVDTPHSCGQVCGLTKKNSNTDFDDCHHKCTLLCHPGPCPQCAVQVLRQCGCGETKVYTQCGQPTKLLCPNICSKTLNCKNHVCVKPCHLGECDPCQSENSQCYQLTEPMRAEYFYNNTTFHRFPAQDYVTAEELRMLGLDPNELFQRRVDEDLIYLNESNDSDSEVNFSDNYNSEDYDDLDDDDMDDELSPPVEYYRYDYSATTEPLETSHSPFHGNGLAEITNYASIQNLSNDSVTEESSTSSNTSTSNSSNNTNNSSNNTSNSSDYTYSSSNVTNGSNNTSTSSSEDDYYYDEDNDDEHPMDLSSNGPYNFDEGESCSEEYSEDNSGVLPSERGDLSSSEDSDDSQSVTSHINVSDSYCTDTTSNTSSSN